MSASWSLLLLLLLLLLLYGLNTRYVVHCDSEESQVFGDGRPCPCCALWIFSGYMYTG